MKPIVITGCPYNGLRYLRTELKNSSVTHFDLTDIVAVTLDVLQLPDGNMIPLNAVAKSFIRYPYDLIPPHTESFADRERTEWIKTVALLLDKVSLNPVRESWAARNRLYSLGVADSVGLKTPKTCLISGDQAMLPDWVGQTVTVKAAGNCFFSNSDQKPADGLQPFLRIEEDDGDIAYILPAAKLATSALDKLRENLPTILIQQTVDYIKEYRIYLIQDTVYVYQREKAAEHDQSASPYHAIKAEGLGMEVSQLFELRRRLGLGYLCIDALQSQSGLVIIDVNPYGSLPPFEDSPEPTEHLARTLISEATNV